jgi:hypothetical protein
MGLIIVLKNKKNIKYNFILFLLKIIKYKLLLNRMQRFRRSNYINSDNTNSENILLYMVIFIVIFIIICIIVNYYRNNIRSFSGGFKNKKILKGGFIDIIFNNIAFVILFMILFIIISVLISYVKNNRIEFFSSEEEQSNNANVNSIPNTNMINGINSTNSIPANCICNTNTNNSSNNINNNNIQKGLSGISQSGYIQFQNPFQNIPYVFTQMIGNDKEQNNLNNVNVYNITQNGFGYSKNKLVEEKINDMTINVLNPSETDVFQWIAYDK